MRTRQLIALLMLAFFTAGLAGCDKTLSSQERQELAEKKAKELRRGTFQPSPRKSYGIGL